MPPRPPPSVCSSPQILFTPPQPLLLVHLFKCLLSSSSAGACLVDGCCYCHLFNLRILFYGHVAAPPLRFIMFVCRLTFGLVVPLPLSLQLSWSGAYDAGVIAARNNNATARRSNKRVALAHQRRSFFFHVVIILVIVVVKARHSNASKVYLFELDINMKMLNCFQFPPTKWCHGTLKCASAASHPYQHRNTSITAAELWRATARPGSQVGCG